ncbi:MAG: phosphoribosylformylglycinamidine synthase subunit PurQ [Deltaproteobacteria bacterium]|nr:phosphoribosylformylglycinamidine synthase subunit PurQ [Deltaproteobacteria bacterium]
MAKIAVVDFPGSNSSAEVVRILKNLDQDAFLLNYRAESAKEAAAIIIPGGFSFGDYLRPGALVKGTPVTGLVKRYANDGKPVLGIGNGFQILCEIGILPGVLLQNPSMKFCNEEANVRVESHGSPFTKYIPEDTMMRLPMACYYGSFYTDKRTIKDLEDAKRVALRYYDQYGEVDLYNGFLSSLHSLAGVTNKEGNVLGLMPRIDLATDSLLGLTDGLMFFKSLINYLNE